QRAAALGVGGLSPLAYVLVLFALTRAPVSLVAPVRESSVVLGALLGARVLGEGDLAKRILAASAIAAGIAVLAEDDIRRTLVRIAHEIVEKNAGRPVALVGIHRRGAHLAQRLHALVADLLEIE